MKHTFLFSIVIFSCISIAAQRKSDIGLFFGGATYIGDINPGKQFYKPGPAMGALFRYNFNKRVALRLNGTYVKISGNSADFPEYVVPFRPVHSFSANLVDLSSQIEYNFSPYITGDKPWLNSTYIAAGIGYSFNISHIDKYLTIPFGAGFKINITNRISAGCEWMYRKTFADDIDNLESPLGTNVLHNNDWYSTYGLFITYKFFKFAADCPVYK